MNEIYDSLKENIIKLKKEGLLTNKLRVYLDGFLHGLVGPGVISLEQAKELRALAEVSKADPNGVAELVDFGDLFDFKDSKLEFDKDGK